MMFPTENKNGNLLGTVNELVATVNRQCGHRNAANLDLPSGSYRRRPQANVARSAVRDLVR